MAPPTCAARFRRLLTEHACRECGSAWDGHSLCVIEGSGHGLLLCSRGHLFSVLYPEGEVFAVCPPGSFLPDPTAIDADVGGPGAGALLRPAPGLFRPPPGAADRPDFGPPGESGGYRPGPAVHLARCPLCGGARRIMPRKPYAVCIDCVRAGFAVLEVGGSPRLLIAGHPVPWSPDVHFDGERPRPAAQSRQEVAHV